LHRNLHSIVAYPDVITCAKFWA